MTPYPERPERVVILCGGRGYRMGEESELRPKPMTPIGNRPVLWHIMKIYSFFGFRRFVLCLGYKGDLIRDYFLRLHEYTQDVMLTYGAATVVECLTPCEEQWEIILAETGANTTTGGRLQAVSKYLDTPRFLMTYGDGVSDVDLDALMRFHENGHRLATLTAVPPSARFGELEVEGDLITGFAEKPQRSHMRINGGFFVLERGVLDYLQGDVFFEREPLMKLAHDGQLGCFHHEGFWQCMDTPNERDLLNQLWEDSAPWARWLREEGC